jgi:hypothetical protein
MAVGASAGAVAAAARRGQFEEEEKMTPYTEDELGNDWEFKIVRANWRVFRNPAEFKKLISQEEPAGWVLLEKLDDSRVRFKRRRSSQANDAQLLANGVDPYRSHYGMSPYAYSAIVFAMTLAVALGIIAVITFLATALPR